jgi:hypothetical protein
MPEELPDEGITRSKEAKEKSGEEGNRQQVVGVCFRPPARVSIATIPSQITRNEVTHVFFKQL